MQIPDILHATNPLIHNPLTVRGSFALIGIKLLAQAVQRTVATLFLGLADIVLLFSNSNLNLFIKLHMKQIAIGSVGSIFCMLGILAPSAIRKHLEDALKRKNAANDKFYEVLING